MQILPYKKIRLIVSICIFALLDSLIYHYFKISGSYIAILICCFVVSFQFWISAEFSQWGSNEIFELNLKSKAKIEEEKIQNKIQLLEGMRNRLIADAVEGHISIDSAKERMDLLQDEINNQPLLLENFV